uniref:Uncharacterized protein n=1 Tax=Oryza punctata TaxID=4537 RepID=A0A0E0KNM8_ORYPU
MTRLATGRLGTGCCRRGRVIALATGGGTRTVAPGTPAWGPEAWGATPGAARTGGGGDGEAWGGRGGGALPLQEDGCRQSRSCTINRTCRIIIVEAICDPVHELWHLAMAHFSPSISHCRWLVITEDIISPSPLCPAISSCSSCRKSWHDSCCEIHCTGKDPSEEERQRRDV